VNFVEGESASGPVVSLFADDSLEVILEVDEADIASLRVGQTADVALEAFPDSTLVGQISAITPRAAGGQGVSSSSLVVYEVHLALDESALPIRSGMTADAHLVVAEREGVLLVANQAINADRSAGAYSVNVVEGETVKEVAVTIGLRDRQYTQILDGLEPGDELLVGNTIPLESIMGEAGGGNGDGPFGGNSNDGGPFGG
jgi:HlyD family secretion protein